uniref:Trafficking protein particle complex subunit 13 n=1 Tax=Chenopodium quinoa TaxID=63459 RepID=A0A803LLE5_CHEQI
MSGASGGAQANHSLAFRVMRLCRPSLHVETPLLFDPADLLVGEGDSSSLLPHSLSSDNSDNGSDNDLSFRSRFLLSDPSSASGLSGLLVLPQSFGAIYLGETFCSYISINNSSNFEVREIVIKAEIQTERQRILLLDTSKSPVETIRAGGRYDFIVEHDVKELGAHTLVCSAMYNDSDGVRKYLPQFFKFIVANPLSVRTKDLTFLEACIENHTKSNLYMDQVEFQPAQHWGATVLTADTNLAEKDSTSDKEIFKPPVLIKSGGGIHNFLYQLKLSAQESTQTRIEGSNILGKLQITWRTNLGEPGRLQTQHILGSPVPRKEIDLQVVKIPPAIILHKPFEVTVLFAAVLRVQLSLTNQTERALGPFEIWFSGDANGERAFMVNGLQTLNLIATKLGVQKITGITVFDSIEKKTYEPLPDLEIFVDLD